MFLGLQFFACLTLLLQLQVNHFCAAGGSEDDVNIVNVDVKLWEQVESDNDKKLLVLLFKEQGCAECKKAIENFDLILGQPEIPADVGLGKSSDAALRNKLGITALPSLVFLRQGSYVVYDGKLDVEPLLGWIPQASQVALHSLDDESFEHLTQAASGATTGDWFVTFIKPGCVDTLSLLETVGVRYLKSEQFRGKVNVAKVNMEDSPALVERFKVKNCPYLIYFRQGKMYRYDLPTLDVASLRSFLDGFYKNSKAELVPVPKSKFDDLTEGIADFIKAQLEGENRNIALAGVCGVVVLFLVIIMLCCRSALEGPPKEKKE